MVRSFRSCALFLVAIAALALEGPATAQGMTIPPGTGTTPVNLASPATVSFRFDFLRNPASYNVSGAPKFGTTITLAVDLSLTGHRFAQVVAFSEPAFVLLAGGQRLLVSGAQLGATPLQEGTPVATFQQAIPNDTSLAGLTFYTQAIHLGTIKPFALSNAVDLTLGR